MGNTTEGQSRPECICLLSATKSNESPRQDASRVRNKYLWIPPDLLELTNYENLFGTKG